LGEIGSWQSGSTPNRARKDYYGGNIAWLRTGDLNDNYVSDIPCTVTDKALEELSLRINPAGSVLLAMYGATIGKVGILKIPATTNQACCACTNFVCISNEYLFYFLLASKQSFIQKGTGGAQPNISKEIIVSTKIPLPSLNEQHRIVLKLKYYLKILDNIYGSINDINSIAKNIKLKILDLSLNGLLTKQDSHDEPAIELLKRINPNFKPCDNSHYRKLPRLWSSIRLGDVCKLIDGEKQCNISRNYLDACYLRSGFGKKCLNGRFVPPNSLLILVDGENSGEIFYTKTGGYQGSTFKMVCIEKKINLEYVLYFINHYKEFLRNHKVGSAIPHLNKKTFRELILPVPPINEQNRIVNIIKKINFHIEQL
jgi:type I restriction enzyme S subunit